MTLGLATCQANGQSHKLEVANGAVMSMLA